MADLAAALFVVFGGGLFVAFALGIGIDLSPERPDLPEPEASADLPKAIARERSEIADRL